MREKLGRWAAAGHVGLGRSLFRGALARRGCRAFSDISLLDEVLELLRSASSRELEADPHPGGLLLGRLAPRRPST